MQEMKVWRASASCNFLDTLAQAPGSPQNRFDCTATPSSSRNALAIGIRFSYGSSNRRMRRYPRAFFRELDPFASHVAVAALAIATWVFLIIPL